MSSFVEALLSALRAESVMAEPEAGGIDCAVRKGLRARRTKLDPDAVASAVADADAGDAALAAFARGVAAWLSEPKRSGGDTIGFKDAAATILPVVDLAHFAIGFEAAAGERPFTTPLTERLHVAYEIELDDGVHVVGTEQARAWGATDERVHKAAISILFHRSWGMDWRPEPENVVRFDGRDGRDASRLAMLDLWDHHRTGKGLLVAVPSPGHLLASEDTSDDGAHRLRAAADAAFERSDSPLCASVWRFDAGRLLHDAVL